MLNLRFVYSNKVFKPISDKEMLIFYFLMTDHFPGSPSLEL
jgi:hypothetical protein